MMGRGGSYAVDSFQNYVSQQNLPEAPTIARSRLSLAIDSGDRAGKSANRREGVAQLKNEVDQGKTLFKGQGTINQHPLDSIVTETAASFLETGDIQVNPSAPQLYAGGSSNSQCSSSKQTLDSAETKATKSLLEVHDAPVPLSAAQLHTRRSNRLAKRKGGKDHISTVAIYTTEEVLVKGLRRSSRVRNPSSYSQHQPSSSSSTSSENGGASSPATQQLKNRYNTPKHSSGKDADMSTNTCSRFNSPEGSASFKSRIPNDPASLKRQRNRDSCMKYRHKRARERDQIKEDISGLRDTVKRLQTIDKNLDREMHDWLEREESYKKRIKSLEEALEAAISVVPR